MREDQELVRCSLKRIDLQVFGLLASASLSCVLIFFFLPADVQEILKARSDDWNLLCFWTSTFVHASFEHLLGNVLSFLALGALVFVLNRASRRERELFYTLMIIILVLPFVANILFVIVLQCLSVKRTVTFCGLSTAVASLVGLIVPSLGVFLEEHLRSGRSNSSRLLLFFVLLTASLISHQTFQYFGLNLYGLMLYFAFLAFGLIPFVYIVRRLASITRQGQNAKGRVIKALIAIGFYLAVYLVFILYLFPSEVITPRGDIINIFSHYTGLLLGIFAGYLGLRSAWRPERLRVKIITGLQRIFSARPQV